MLAHEAFGPFASVLPVKDNGWACLFWPISGNNPVLAWVAMHRLMRENGICVKRTRKYTATTDSNHKFNIAPNLLNQDFHANGPNQKWAGDISYIWTREGWLYLAVILDLHSRRVIGWAVSNRMKRDLAIRALEMAIFEYINGFYNPR